MARQESARNIAAPVVAVASTAQALYATDGRALVMLNRDDSDPKYWREVPGLGGQRAIPVVADQRPALASARASLAMKLRSPRRRRGTRRGVAQAKRGRRS